MSTAHHYHLTVTWTGNKGTGTSGYANYDRSHTVQASGKPVIYGSSDAAFRGDVQCYNPEDMLVSALSSCHMLWYLHICADAGVIVTQYTDHAIGTMEVVHNGSGKFIEVILHPKIIVADVSMIDKALALHEEAHKMCFIANSVNFPVLQNPLVEAAS
jgi:organic hydroperoxide reductase OsmC/OhrA